MRHFHLFAFIVALPFIALLLPPAFAQDTEQGYMLDDNLQLKATGPEGEFPLLEKTSEKGIYKVQLRWPQMPLNPDNAFDLQIVFLNASAPNATLPQAESNFTGSGSEVGSTVPGIVDSPLPVESYDIAIYANDGRALWKKAGQPGEGGMPGQRIDFEGNYTGPVTIEITNIKPGWETTTASEDVTDSVTFTATVVPEFPVIAFLPLAAGVSAAIVALRLKRTRVT